MSIDFNRENLDIILKDLGKVFKKLNGNNMPAEIILIGGASILTKYGFRKSTRDVDAIIRGTSVMKEAIDIVGEKYNLPSDWLNMDFKETDSYSSRLIEVSKHYKTFSNILNVRIVEGEYLIAMKLIAGRSYKHDLSDIAGILWEHEKSKNPINIESIKKAVDYLYGDWNKVSEKSRELLEDIYKKENYERYYKENKVFEEKNRTLLSEFKINNPNVIRKENINEILEELNKKDVQ